MSVDMNWSRIDATFALVMGYLTAVPVAMVVPALVRWAWTGEGPLGSSPLADGLTVFFFGLYVIANWVTVAAPFALVRWCGGFGTAWLSVVGGVMTAYLASAVDVAVVVAIYPDILVSAPMGNWASAWLVIAMSGAAGGLTYWSVERLFRRLFRWAST